MDLFTTWFRWLDINLKIAETMAKSAETFVASSMVIAIRSRKIGTAMVAPLTADRRELALMIPEKVAAFSKSGEAAVNAWHAMHRLWLRQTGQLARAILSGEVRIATPWPWLDSIARMNAATLAPIHRTATRNAKRLENRHPKR
ncbi:MAG: hypothetical protein J0I25_02795 [Sphingomonadales bacterium]|nr:hypothetical protein [Sphingomonadales bacterium]